MVDYPGQYAAVFFTSGCNFRCGYCHNAELIRERDTNLPWERVEEVCRAFRDQWVNAAVISGGEPTLQIQLPALIHLFKEYDFKVKLDTNGSRPDMLERCLPLIDYAAMDVKAGPRGYPEMAGFDKLDDIRRSIDLIRASGVEYEFRTTVIKTLHGETAMHEIGELIDGARRYVLQPFLPRAGMRDSSFERIERTSVEHLSACRDWIRPYVHQAVVRGVDA